MKRLGRTPNIKDVNASPLIGKAFVNSHHQFEGLILWHQAVGEDWVDDEDLITYVWTIDGNEACPVTETWFEFRIKFNVDENLVRQYFDHVEKKFKYVK